MPRPRSQKAIIKDVAALIDAAYLSEFNHGRYNNMASVVEAVLTEAGLSLVKTTELSTLRDLLKTVTDEAKEFG